MFMYRKLSDLFLYRTLLSPRAWSDLDPALPMTTTKQRCVELLKWARRWASMFYINAGRAHTTRHLTQCVLFVFLIVCVCMSARSAILSSPPPPYPPHHPCMNNWARSATLSCLSLAPSPSQELHHAGCKLTADVPNNWNTSIYFARKFIEISNIQWIFLWTSRQLWKKQ